MLARDVGPDDDFFELGGQSVGVMQIVVRVREASAVELGVRDFFELRTPRALAQWIESQRVRDLPGLRPRADRGASALAVQQYEIWLHTQKHRGSPAYNLAVALELCGELNVRAVGESLETIARRHEVLRCRYVLVDARPTAQLGAFAWSDMLQLGATQDLAQAAAAEATRPFDLAAGPVMRVQLLKLGPELHALLFTIHHIAADAWSLGRLLSEFATCYTASCAGIDPVLPALPVQYRDYVAWQREWLDSPEATKQLNQVCERLAGARAVPLPEARSAPGSRGKKIAVSIDAATCTRLEEVARQHQATLFMLLMAAFKVALARTWHEWDVVLATTVSGRSQLELEPLIGCFVNTIVLRTNLEGDPTYAEALQRVRDTALAAYAHLELPLQEVTAALGRRGERAEQLSQVLFTLHDAIDVEAVELPDLTVRRLDLDDQLARRPLTLRLQRGECGAVGVLEYDVSRLDDQSVAGLRATLMRVVGAYTQASSARIASTETHSGRHDELRSGLRRAFRQRATPHSHQSSSRSEEGWVDEPNGPDGVDG